MAEIPADTASEPIPVLQELVSATAAAGELVADIAARFARGDAAAEQLAELHALVAELGRYAAAGGEVPEAVRVELARLLDGVRAATAAGAAWAERSSSPSAADTRVRRAYGLPP